MITRQHVPVGAVHCALRPRGGGLRGGGGRGDHGAQAHRQAILHLQVGARVKLQTKVHPKVHNYGEGPNEEGAITL